MTYTPSPHRGSEPRYVWKNKDNLQRRDRRPQGLTSRARGARVQTADRRASTEF